MKDKRKKIKEDEWDNGYFSKLHKELGGDRPDNNLKGFEFKKDVLNQYSDLSLKNPMEFKIKESVGIYYINHIGKWDLKCDSLKNGNVGAILIDLTNIPKDQREWWADHLLKEK